MMTTPTPEQIQTISRMLHEQDYCAQTLNMKVHSVTLGEAVLSMPVTKTYANGHGFCQGGIITALADTAFAHASNSYNRRTVAQGLSMDFVRPACIHDVLTASATQLSQGNTTGVYQVKVHNQQNKLLAIMMGKSFSTTQAIL